MIDASHLTDKVQTVPFCDFLLSSEPPSELKDRGGRCLADECTQGTLVSQTQQSAAF